MYTREQVAGVIDHAVLKPFATDRDIIENAAMCVRLGVGNMCVRPTDVPLAVKELANSPCTVATVIGFPHGINMTGAKAVEARLTIADGADELDMVMNVGRFLSGDDAFVQKDIEAVVAEARKKPGVPVKVILEVCYLSPEQIAHACKIAEAAGARYVKTATGFGDGGATPEAIDIMMATVGETMSVKASGGIHTWDQAVGYLEQGCKRLGVGSTEAVLDGAPN